MGRPSVCSCRLPSGHGLLGQRQANRACAGLPGPPSGDDEHGQPSYADLVLERRSDLTDLFFVNHRVIPLPPEPVRLPVAKAIQGLSRVTAIRRR